jgi:hypothetical protein
MLCKIDPVPEWTSGTSSIEPKAVAGKSVTGLDHDKNRPNGERLSFRTLETTKFLQPLNEINGMV